MEFLGTDRFKIQRRLGEGGMGVVYQVYDEERRQVVALKTLTRTDAANIYRLKKEFRSLTDIHHPNVIGLYELIAENEDWFFTMELIEGQDFTRYTRRRTAPSGASPLTPPWKTPGAPKQPNPDVTIGDEPELPFDVQRLRECLLQLIQGVHAIHSAGKLHRDLKPSNVLVSDAGRVVVLDFGLVQDHVSEGHADMSQEGNLVVGTPAFMAPEQAAGLPATEASDWYSVGAILFNALTGVLPFSGSVRHVLAQKQHLDPPQPSEFLPAIPDDLNRLSVDLLSREPTTRPSYRAMLSRLGFSDVVQSQVRVAAPTPPPHEVFVGREDHLRVLATARAEVSSAAPQFVCISGKDGMGKSTLLNHFLEAERRRDSGVVLAGRCYQQESVPFKAFDTVVDALSRYLRRLEPEEVEAVLPRDVAALVRMFPVLERVDAIRDAPRIEHFTREPAQLRARAFAAMKDLLGRLSDRLPLVVGIDDLHFGDADSAELLLALTSEPAPPSLLLIATVDSDWADDSVLLRQLPGPAQALGSAERRDLLVDALPTEDALSLTVDLLGTYDEKAWSIARSVAKEAEGSPFIIRELLGFIVSKSAESDPTSAADPSLLRSVSFDGVFREKLSQLSDPARRLLQTAAVASGPLPIDALTAAAQLGDDERNEAISELRRHSWLRLTKHKQQTTGEISQARIETLVMAGLEDDVRKQQHLQLAKALRKVPSLGLRELIATHYEAGGDPESAAEHYVRAAEQAVQALAFERASELFAAALPHVPSKAQQFSLLVAQADALESASRHDRAATVLLSAAALAPALDQAARLSKRALELKLRHSQVDALFRANQTAERQYTLFDGIDRDEVQSFLAKSEVLEGDAGTRLVKKGDATSAFWVVLSGSLELKQEGARSATLEEGEVLGEVPFLLDTPRMVDIYAASKGTRVLSMSREALAELSSSNPRLALQLVMNLARIVSGKLLSVRARAFGNR